MEIELPDVSAVPEHLKPILAGNKLDLTKLMPMEDLTGLKTALQTERANAGAYAKFGKPDELAKKLADLQAQVDKGGKGGEDAQAKMDALKATYDAQLSDRDQRLSSLMKRQANAELRAELAKVGVVPEGLDILANFAAQRIAFNDDGTPKVMTADGKPMIGSGADHGATLADLAKELAKAIPHLVKDGGAGGSGKQPNDGGKPDRQTVTRAAFEAMSQAERSTFSKSGGKVTD